MKKTFAIILSIFALLTLTACVEAVPDDSNIPLGDAHTHSYTVMSTDSKYLATKANCENAATYFYSCSCGEKGSESFSYGTPTEHSFLNGVCELCSSEGTPSLTYELTDGEYTVTGVSQNELTIVIPSTYKGIAVTAIAEGAFSGCKDLLSIELGSNIKEIPQNAFAEFTKLTEILNRSLFIDLSNMNSSTTEIHNGERSKIIRVGDFLFYLFSDNAPCLIHYLGADTEITLPSAFHIDPEMRILLPEAMLASDYEKDIMLPMLSKFAALAETLLKDSYPDLNFSFIDNEKYKAYENGCLSNKAIRKYTEDMLALIDKKEVDKKGYMELEKLNVTMQQFIGNFALKNPTAFIDNPIYAEFLDKMYEQYPITKNGTAIYVFVQDAPLAKKVQFAGYFKVLCPDLDSAMLLEYEKRAGIEMSTSYSVSDLAFAGCGITKITETGVFPFRSNTSLVHLESLKEIVFGKDFGFNSGSVAAMANSPSLECVTVDSANEYFYSVDGIAYSKDGRTLVFYPPNKAGDSFTVPDTVTEIGEAAFFKAKNLTSITIPTSVTTIQLDALNSLSLKGIYITDLAAWCGNTFYGTVFGGASLFLNGELVTDLVIPESVTSISHGAFAGCASLKSVTIHDKVTQIGRSTFDNCNNLEKITVPFIGDELEYESDLIISNKRFVSIFSSYGYVPKSLKTVVITSTDYIPYYAFVACYDVECIVISKTVKEIAEYAFADCFALTDIYYTGTEEEWKEITVGENNEILDGVTIHFEYTQNEE